MTKHLIILLLSALALSFMGCSSSSSEKYREVHHMIVAECIGDSLFYTLSNEIEKLGYKIDQRDYGLRGLSAHTSRVTNGTGSPQEIIYWSYNIKDNRFIASSRWVVANTSRSGYHSRNTSKSNRYYWDVREIFEKYCDMRDSTYIHEYIPDSTPL